MTLLDKTRIPEALDSDVIARLVSGLQSFAVEERYPLLIPGEADREELAALVPLVVAEVEALRKGIAASATPEG